MAINLSEFDFTNKISDLQSETGLVLGFKSMSVKPLKDAIFPPFSIVSLSSYPGSPKQMLLSNQPLETCNPLMSMIFESFD